MKRFILKFWPYGLLLVIIGLSAFLRLNQIDKYMTFLGDEGRDVLIVKRMIIDHKWTLLGPTASVGGFFMGPIYYYFMMPFLWASNLNPVGPAIGVALVGILTNALVYLVGARWFSRRVGFIAAALYAISPLIISYSRSSWNPNIIPFFSLLSMYLMWLSIVQKKGYLLLFVGIASGIGIQLHYTYLFFLFGAVLFLGMNRNSFSVKDYALGIAGILIGFSPFLAFELRHGFSNTIAIFQFITSGKDTGFQVSSFITTAFDILYRLFARLVLRLPDAGQLSEVSKSTQNVWFISGVFLTVAGVSSLVAGVWSGKVRSFFFGKTTDQKDKRRALAFQMMAAIVGSLILLFGLYKKNIYDYYFGIVYPLPFILTAQFCDIFLIRKVLKYVGMIFVGGLIVFNLMGQPFQHAPNNQLGQMQHVARVVATLAGDNPYNFALITGGNSDHAYRYFLELWGKSPTTIEYEGADPDRKTVTDQLIVVCEDISCRPLGHSLWEIAGFGRAEVVEERDVSVVKVFKMKHYEGEQK